MSTFNPPSLTPPTRAVVLLLCAVAATWPAPTTRATPTDRVEELEDRLLSSTNPDSMVLVIAAEWRNQATIVSRQRAFDVLEEHKSSLWDNPEYHRELALLLLDSKRYSNAYSSFSDVLDRKPDDIPARMEMVRIKYRQMYSGEGRYGLRTIEGLLDECLPRLEERLGIRRTPAGSDVDSVFRGPTELTKLYRDACYLRSLSHYEARFLEEGSAARDIQSQKGRDLTEEIIRRFPFDQRADARMLNGVHCMDLGDLASADRWFRQGIHNMRIAHRSRYLVPPQLAQRREFKEAKKNVEVIRRYWDEFADPVTGINEVQLQFWYNLAIADARFQDPMGRRIKGGDTFPGLTVARFGLPPAMEYDARGFVSTMASAGAADPTRRWDRPGPTHPFKHLPPQLHLKYPGLTLTFEYMHGSGWQPDFATAEILKETGQADDPPIITLRDRNAIDRVFMAHTGWRGTYSRGKETLLAAIPPWDDSSKWWKEAEITVEVLSTQSVVVEWEKRIVRGEDLFEVAPGRNVILVGRNMELPPGHYTGYVTITDKHGYRTGRGRIPMDVEVIRFEKLALSELEMLFPGTYGTDRRLARADRTYLPNPFGTVGGDGWFEVAYSIYNLDPGPGGDGLYQVTYTILPRNYRLGMAKLRKERAVSALERSEMAKLGHTIGGVTLMEDNFREVRFPPAEIRGLGSDGREIQARAAIDASTLPPGQYVLQLNVKDLVSGEVTTQEMEFRKVSDEDFEAMIAARDR